MRKVRRYAAILGVALVLALVMAGLAVQMGSRARRATHEAQSQRSGAFSRELAASALAGLPDDAERSLLLALHSVDVARAAGLAPPAESEVALHAALQAWRLDAEIRADAPVAVSPDGTVAATLAADGALQVWDLVTLQHKEAKSGIPRLSLPGGATIFAFSPDSSRLAWADAQGQIVLINAADGGTALTLMGNPGGVSQLHFSADGSRLLSYGADLTARAWDLATGQQTAAFSRAPSAPNQVSLSSNGRYLIAATANGAYIVDTRTGAPPRFLMQAEEVAFCGQTARFVVNSVDYVRFYDVASETLSIAFSVEDRPVTALACSPDGTAPRDRRPRPHDANLGYRDGTPDPQPERPRGGPPSRIHRNGRSADRLPAGPHGDLARFRRQRTPFPADAGWKWRARDQQRRRAAGRGRQRRGPDLGLDDPERNRLVRGKHGRLGRRRAILSASGPHGSGNRSGLQPGRRRLATGSSDGSVLLWDPPTDSAADTTSIAPVQALPRNGASVIDIVFSPDGTRLAIVADSVVRVWDVNRGTPDSPLMTYIPPGATFATAPLAVAWNPRGGQPRSDWAAETYTW